MHQNEIIIKDANINDIERIKDFINKNWKKNHILTKSDIIFNSYYVNQNLKKKIYFKLALSKKNQLLVGILGYTPYSIYDSNIKDNGIWLSMWLTIPFKNVPVGILLLNELINNKKNTYFATLGANTNVLSIYNKFGFKVGSMNHWILPIKNFNYPSINTTFTRKKNLYSKNIKIKFFKKNSSIKLNYYGKSINYLNNKYLLNTFYKYIILELIKNKKTSTIIVGRIIKIKRFNINIFKIIDVLGDPYLIDYSSCNLIDFFFDQNIHYIDFLFKDLKREKKLINFKKSTKNNFVPIYFEPLILKYDVKNYCVKFLNNKILPKYIYSGDCDQDRPNIIRP